LYPKLYLRRRPACSAACTGRVVGVLVFGVEFLAPGIATTVISGVAALTMINYQSVGYHHALIRVFPKYGNGIMGRN
jgi:hypothetical protein